MTCIVAVNDGKKIVLGGDRAAVGDIDIRIVAKPKIFTVGKFSIGYTSSFRMGQLLQYKLKVLDQLPEQSDYEYMVTTFIDAIRDLFSTNGYEPKEKEEIQGGTFIVIYNKIIYQVEDDFQIGIMADPFTAVGCGDVYANATMKALLDNKPELNAKEIATQGLKNASYFCGGVHAPYDFIEIEV